MLVYVILIVLFFMFLSTKGDMKNLSFKVKCLKEELDEIKDELKFEKVKKYLDKDVVDNVTINETSINSSKPTPTKVPEEEIVEVSKTMGRAAEPISPKPTEVKRPVVSYPASKSPVFAKKVEIEEPKKEKSALLQNIEKLFAGNVTGVLGIAAVIVGIIFLAIYAAISMGPLPRFMVVCSASIFFYVSYIVLNRYDVWKDISLWFRTASGVIFLVACIGASQFNYMRWIYNDTQAWTLIMVGIFVNIVFGMLSKKEIFAAVHVVLSLLALLIMPFTYLSFVIAAIISFTGLLIALGNKKWDTYLTLVNISFMVVNLFWTNEYAFSWPSSNLPTIALCLLVAIPCLLNHYRELYREKDNRAMFSHMVIWLTLGINLYFHSKGSMFSTIALGVGSVVTFASSYWAYKKKAEWLFTCDRLASLAMGMFTIVSLYKFDITYYQMAFLLSIFTIIFLKLTTINKNAVVFKIVNSVHLLSNIIFLIMLSYMIMAYGNYNFDFIICLVLNFAILAKLFPSIENFAKEEEFGFDLEDDKKEKSTSTFIAPLFVSNIFVITLFAAKAKVGYEIAYLLGLALLAISIIIKGYHKNRITDACVSFSTKALTFFYLFAVFGFKYDMLFNAQIVLGVIVVALLSLKFNGVTESNERRYSGGIFIVWLSLMVSSYVFIVPYSTMVVGILWLAVFLLCCDLKEITWKNAPIGEGFSNPSVMIAKLGILSLGLFVMRYCFVDIYNNTLLFGFIYSRMFTEIISIFSIIYWMMSGTNREEKAIKDIVNALLEIVVVLGFAYIVFEIDNVAIQGIFMSSIAILFFIFGPKFKLYNRLTLYGYVLYMIGLFYVGFVASTAATPSSFIFDQIWFKGLVIIAISIIFAVQSIRNLDYIRNTDFNIKNKALDYVRNSIVKHNARVVIYPLFIAVAFFLSKSFDKSILSILLMIECFVLFILSLLMKKSEFRVVSMACVALIFFRIMFFDLQGHDFLIKAIIFIVIGSILIMMNAIYNKYKYRYEN